MKTTPQKLNNEIPAVFRDKDPQPFFTQRIVEVAWEILAEITSLSSFPSLSLEAACKALEKRRPNEFIEYASQLLEDVLQDAEQQALELPDIESSQYCPSEIGVMTLEIAFAMIEDADSPHALGEEARAIRQRASDLAWKKLEEDEENAREVDDYLEVVNWYWDHR